MVKQKFMKTCPLCQRPKIYGCDCMYRICSKCKSIIPLTKNNKNGKCVCEINRFGKIKKDKFKKNEQRIERQQNEGKFYPEQFE